ncbi:MAG: HAD-IB family phosphatase [Niabella sp.]
MKQQKYFIIDFDSTFTQVEALDELAAISLSKHPDRKKIYKKIEEYTNLAMEGKLSFTESLEKRIQLLEADKEDLKKLVTHLKKKVSKSFSRNKEFFKKHPKEVLIVSGGFKEFIIPVVKQYHIKKENVYANTFIFNKEGKIIGYDTANPLSREGGKVELLKKLQLQGDLYGIGDGYSDFQLRESGLIKKFFAFTENISRKSVTEKADHITPSLDEFLFVNKLPGAISYPKNRINCNIIGKAPKEAVTLLKEEGYTTILTEKQDTAIETAGLVLLAENINLDAKFIKKAKRLKTIGCLGSVPKDFPLELCSNKGIVVFAEGKPTASSVRILIRRMIDYINTGATNRSVNFPHIQLPAINQSHRFIHIHKNIPGIIAEINSILAKHNINIIAQFLLTNETIGYVIIDVHANYDESLIKALKKVEHTIQFRTLY